MTSTVYISSEALTQQQSSQSTIQPVNLVAPITQSTKSSTATTTPPPLPVTKSQVLTSVENPEQLNQKTTATHQVEDQQNQINHHMSHKSSKSITRCCLTSNSITARKLKTRANGLENSSIKTKKTINVKFEQRIRQLNQIQNCRQAKAQGHSTVQEVRKNNPPRQMFQSRRVIQITKNKSFQKILRQQRIKNTRHRATEKVETIQKRAFEPVMQQKDNLPRDFDLTELGETSVQNDFLGATVLIPESSGQTLAEHDRSCLQAPYQQPSHQNTRESPNNQSIQLPIICSNQLVEQGGISNNIVDQQKSQFCLISDEDPLTYLSNLRIESDSTARGTSVMGNTFVCCPDLSTAMDSTSMEQSDDSLSHKSFNNNQSSTSHESPINLAQTNLQCLYRDNDLTNFRQHQDNQFQTNFTECVTNLAGSRNDCQQFDLRIKEPKSSMMSGMCLLPWDEDSDDWITKQDQ